MNGLSIGLLSAKTRSSIAVISYYIFCLPIYGFWSCNANNAEPLTNLVLSGSY
jgi:hypothetical protein